MEGRVENMNSKSQETKPKCYGHMDSLETNDDCAKCEHLQSCYKETFHDYIIPEARHRKW